MKIVILDGKTTNPGDLTWEPIEKLGELTVYPSTPPELVCERSKDAEALILNRCAVDDTLLARLPKLRFIGMLATGYNAIDTEAAHARGVTVCNVPTYCAPTVAQTAFSLLLSLCIRTEHFSELVKSGRWEDSVALNYSECPIFELYGKTMGILGFGSIGRECAGIARAFGMNVLVSSRTRKELPAGCEFTTHEELFRKSDTVSVHMPLNSSTRAMIGEKLLSLMKPSALLINTSRGGVIDEQALACALNSGRLAGFGADVLSSEPPQPDNPLLTAKNCVFTPHIAWASKEARARLINCVAENLSAFLSGKPQNTV